MALAECNPWIWKKKKRLKVINYHFKATCESHWASLATYKEIHFSSSWREEKAEVQDADLILRVELREDCILNSHSG